MWTAISAGAGVAATILGLLWYLFAIGTNSHVRAQAEKHPDSWMYLYISLFDQCLEATLFRPIRSKPGAVAVVVPSVKGTDNTRAYLGFPEFLTADYAIQVIVNPMAMVPNRVRALCNPGILLVGLWGIPFIVLTLISIPFLSFVPSGAVFSVLALFMLVSFVFLLATMVTGRGPFGVLLNLHINPYLVLHMTNQLVLLHSSWMPRTSFAVDDVSFSASEGRFMSEILISTSDGAPSKVVFSYPAYFRQFLMAEGDLTIVVEKLNRLVSIARSSPRLDFNQPLFGAIASALAGVEPICNDRLVP